MSVLHPDHVTSRQRAPGNDPQGRRPNGIVSLATWCRKKTSCPYQINLSTAESFSVTFSSMLEEYYYSTNSVSSTYPHLK